LQQESVVSCDLVAPAAVCQAMDMESATATTATSPFFDALRVFVSRPLPPFFFFLPLDFFQLVCVAH
jgi:hypothetical protein